MDNLLIKENTDLRLIPAYERINLGNIKVLSIDIFDTLIWRKVPIPADLFLLLGQQLKAEGWLIEAVTAEGFEAMRSQAESLAKIKKAKEQGIQHAEVTLKEIYWTISGLF